MKDLLYFYSCTMATVEDVGLSSRHNAKAFNYICSMANAMRPAMGSVNPAYRVYDEPAEIIASKLKSAYTQGFQPIKFKPVDLPCFNLGVTLAAFCQAQKGYCELIESKASISNQEKARNRHILDLAKQKLAL